MTHLIKTFAILILLMLCENSQAQTTEEAKNPLENIQQRIKGRFTLTFQANSPDTLFAISKNLEQLSAQNRQSIISYWQAYAQYYLAIYYSVRKDAAKSEQEIDKGIEILKSIVNKSSEDYALLSLLQGFAIRFKGMPEIISLSQQIKENGKLATQKDNENPRAYYALASNDFYTPEQYGGGKNTEEYLLKVIELPAQKAKNPYRPSWGKSAAYEMLIRWYIRKEQWGKAKKYYALALKKYPQNHSLLQFQKLLKDK